MYLFDTDILSQVAKKRRPAGLIEKLARTPRASQFTSAISVAEIYYGIFKMESRDGVRLSPRGLLRRFFEEEVFARLNILPFDRDSAEIYGRLKSGLELKGRPLSEPDLQIAAIALQHGLAVVTGNVRHFSRIPGLKVESWLGA
jgi:tRNA(fMet)-specific endonuclease VapC